MNRPKVLFLLLALLYASPQWGHPGPPVDKVLSLYRRADDLYRLTNSTPITDSMAIAGFSEVIRMLPSLPSFKEKDTIQALSWFKKGIVLDGGGHYAQAIQAYHQTLNVHPEDDSLALVVKVYTGAAYYNLNNFDSADYFLQKAQTMTATYHDWDAEVRLYNTLGVLYYDNGNYQQGINYFNQALRLVEGRRPFDTISSVNVQTNIATCFYRLGLYQDALALYKKILAYRLATNLIYINMGRTYAALDEYTDAMSCFRRVDFHKIPAVLNEMASTQLQLHRLDSCGWYLDRIHTLSPVNPLDMGINQLYRADWLTDKQDYKGALAALQQSISIFSRGNGNNPTNFTGAFAYFRLFDALLKKAQVLGLLYRSDPREIWLQTSWQAYSAALSLLRYIEKSYDTDDAKLFLNKKSAGVYDGALAACLQLNRLHPDSSYLEQAFLISEKSKATIIFANLRENAFMSGASGADDQALKEMRNLKYNIARLNVLSDEGADPATIESISRQKAEYEIALARLQKQLEQNNAYYKLKYDDAAPGLKDIQQKLTGDQALISYYAAAGALHAFILTRESIAHTREDSIGLLQKDVESWLSRFKTADNGRRWKAGEVGDRLYQRLVKPIQDAAPSKHEWIIVPDGFLYYLPFESLPGGNGIDVLLKTTTISYRLSSQLLSALSPPQSNRMNVLSFAPFASRSMAGLPRLPASQDEISGLTGAEYIDSAATKSNFLKAANHYPIIHLATHAISSLTSAAGSFIAFYPSTPRPDENNLYLEELYGLNLSATRLVIISACETGQGELVGKEGVISLSRAFIYAGCASTINSLWKADDKATAFILKRLYIYLKKGYTKARALQQAKLDYLSGDAIDKSPAFWAHLVLMGDESPLYHPVNWWLWGAIGGVVIAGAAAGWMMRRKRKKSTIF